MKTRYYNCGAELRRIRQSLGLEQVDAGKLDGVTQGCWCRKEQTRSMNFGTFERALASLGYGIEEVRIKKIED